MPLNVQCKRCANLKNGWCESVIDSPDPDLNRDCKHFRIKTNYDKIRDMTIEELANKISGIESIALTCKGSWPPEKWLDWLRREALP